MLDTHLEVFQDSAGLDSDEIRPGLIVQPHLVVTFESRLHRWNQDVIVVAPRDLAPAGKGEHVGGETLQFFDHAILSSLPPDRMLRRRRLPAGVCGQGAGGDFLHLSRDLLLAQEPFLP